MSNIVFSLIFEGYSSICKSVGTTFGGSNPPFSTIYCIIKTLMVTRYSVYNVRYIFFYENCNKNESQNESQICA